MSENDIWSIAFHLSGTTLLGRTHGEPLGALPYPVRSAVLRTAHRRYPSLIAIDEVTTELDYTGGEYSFVDGWSVLDKDLEIYLQSTRPRSQSPFASAEKFFEHYGLVRPKQGRRDEHFAERRFIREIFIPIFGLEGLNNLAPQFHFTDFQGKRRRIDFVLYGEREYALEIEGQTYHSENARETRAWANSKARQAALAILGVFYTPIPFKGIESGSAKGILQGLVRNDRVLERLASRSTVKGSALASLKEAVAGNFELELLLSDLPYRYQAYQRLAFSLLRRAEEKGLATLNLVDYRPEIPLLSLAVLDTVALIERAAELYGLSVELPQVEVFVVSPTEPALHFEVLDAFRCSTGTGAAQGIDQCQTTVSIRNEPPSLDCETHFSSCAEALNVTGAPDGAMRLDELSSRAAAFLRFAGARPPQDLRPTNPSRSILDYFARRFCPYGELKAEQVELIQRVLAGESVLGILPTGFGKSAVFQLATILSPRRTLVISPLKSLMRDQLYGLRSRGLTFADLIVGGMPSDEKQATLEGFSSGRTRLLYVAPERLLMKGFVNELGATAEDWPLGLIVVDEAHCVSEWGHGFRPSYLRIAPLREALQKASSQPIPLLALTATASLDVRDDLMGLLGLEAESVTQLSSSDRPNISLSVHALDPQCSSTAKAEQLARLFESVLPHTLETPFEELVPLDSSGTYPHAGLVFTVYADPHGKATLLEGTHGTADELNERVLRDSNLIRVHHSEAPDVCPKCGSPLFRYQSEGAASTYRFRCTKCWSQFNQARQQQGWEQTIQRTQDDFQANRFPILVATKGYGMGIDKRNVRYVVHNALSSGFESYYQEAGRAGRDGGHSHAALVYRPPTSRCRSDYLENGLAPPCVTNKKSFKYYECPLGLKDGLCDVGKQARFIAGDFAGVEEDVEMAVKVHRESKHPGKIHSKGEQDSKIEMTLHRLQQLDLVAGYATTYMGNTVVFEVETPETFDAREVEERLAKQLKRMKSSDAEVETQLGRLHVLPSKTAPGGGPSDDFVEEAVRIVLERVYEVVPRMRYTMLLNLLRYAESTKCRRIQLRAVFDAAPPDDDYQCGFCDVCNPALSFETDSAAIPIIDSHVGEISKRLPETYARFDLSELQRIVELAVSKGAVQGIFHRVSSALESEAGNPAALYLAGSLGSRLPELKGGALHNLKTCFDELRRRGVGRQELMFVYREGRKLDEELAFRWLDASVHQFDDQEGLKILEKEARLLLGDGRQEVRTLAALREVRGMNDLEADLTELADASARLLDTFPSSDEASGPR